MKRDPPVLRVINGDLAQHFTINGITIQLSALQRHLPEVGALVIEQDTGLLLDETIALSHNNESVGSLTDAMLEDEYHYPLGTVLVKSGHPLRLHTVVHDLENSPNWSPQGIELALRHLLTLLSSLELKSVAMPALAHHHGCLEVEHFLTLLCDYLAQHPLPWRGELWLLLPQLQLKGALATLHTLCDIHHPA